jgi:acylphosphatase
MAKTLGLVGWVRNTNDGSLEAVAEGPRDKLEEFAVAIKRGPSSSEVGKIDVSWEKATGEFEDFQIRL